DEVAGVLQIEAGRDLAAGRLGGGRGEGDARDVGPAFVQAGQHQVVGAEVVPPLRHAVRLVDGEQGDVPAVEQFDGGGELQPLGRQIEQVELARDELGLDDAAFVEVLRGVEEAGPDAERLHRVHLVLHEGDERRDDDPGAL